MRNVCEMTAFFERHLAILLGYFFFSSRKRRRFNAVRSVSV